MTREGVEVDLLLELVSYLVEHLALRARVAVVESGELICRIELAANVARYQCDRELVEQLQQQAHLCHEQWGPGRAVADNKDYRLVVLPQTHSVPVQLVGVHIEPQPQSHKLLHGDMPRDWHQEHCYRNPICRWQDSS